MSGILVTIHDICRSSKYLSPMLLFLQAQNQACEQSMVEAEKDFKKMIDHISETHDTVEVSFAAT